MGGRGSPQIREGGAGVLVKGIAEGEVLFLDTMVFIYHFEDHPALSGVTERLFEAVERGRYQAVTSFLTLLEILVKPKREGNLRAAADYRDLLTTFPNLRFRSLDLPVAETGSMLRAQYGLRTPDAIQIATALCEGAGAFLTNDAELKKIRQVQVVLLGELKD